MPNDLLAKDFASLRESLVQQGFFKSNPFRVWGTALAGMALFVVGAILQDRAEAMSVFAAALGGITLVWWIHDAGHDAFFESKPVSKTVIEALGILFLGMPQIEYHYSIHRKHHARTNIIGADPALDTGPIVWSSEIQKLTNRVPWKYQDFVWFLFVLPLTWPLITAKCIGIMFKNASYGRLLALASRWVLALWFFKPVFVFVPILITGFVLGFAATLNHFHLPTSARSPGRFPINVFITTQNIANQSSFVTWLMGGLNFHIEHHLFPTMPSYHLREISPMVREFAEKHNLKYQTCSSFTAFQKVRSALRGVASR